MVMVHGEHGISFWADPYHAVEASERLAEAEDAQDEVDIIEELRGEA